MILKRDTQTLWDQAFNMISIENGKLITLEISERLDIALNEQLALQVSDTEIYNFRVTATTYMLAPHKRFVIRGELI